MFLAVGKDADDDFLANLVRSLVHFGTPKSSIVYHSFAEFQKLGLLRAIGETLDGVKDPINQQHN